MKTSVVKEIFYGKKRNLDSIKITQSYKERLNAICDIEEKLKKTLSSKQFKLHEKFLSLINANFRDEIDSCFLDGFKIGLLIGFECFNEN